MPVTKTSPVFIVYVPDATGEAPDVARMNQVEELPADLARAMLNDGSARNPTSDELAEFSERRALQTKAAEAEDLTAMKKDELLALLSDEQQAELPPRATKADIAAAVEKNRAAQPAVAAEVDEGVNPDSAATGTLPRPGQPPVFTDSQGNSDTGVEPVE